MRHADVSYFDRDGRFRIRADVPLTPEGRKRARVAGEALAQVAFDRAVTSGLRRTRETAEEVLRGRTNAPPVEAWREFSELRSGRYEEIADEMLDESFLGPFRGTPAAATRFIGGEELGSLFDRVVPALEKLRNDRGWKCALLVLHGAVNRAILSYALTGRRIFLGNLQQSPACLNILDVGNQWLVWAINVTPGDPIHAGSKETSMEKILRRYRQSLVRP
jgi:probable phosphoglycerate mutase